MSLSHFFIMGGYGAYVWSAYGLTLLVLGSHLLLTWLQKKRVNKLIKKYHEY